VPIAPHVLGVYVVAERGYPAWLYGVCALIANLAQSMTSAIAVLGILLVRAPIGRDITPRWMRTSRPLPVTNAAARRVPVRRDVTRPTARAIPAKKMR